MIEKVNKNLTPKESKHPTGQVSRPPVVVVLGHVDHGKSSLLNAIKDFKIIEKESGGITQHIGAYEVEENGKKITFIDTPGHEAFSAMRARGAGVADIAILVIDASESVQPQTKEAIMAIKKAGIPMVVALNKMDKPSANPEKIKRELSQVNILVESMAGKVPSVEVSAKTKQGIKELLDLILLVAEMEQIKADAKVSAEGVVIEAYLDSFRGPTATLIVKNGTLNKKDIIATDTAMAKIKGLENFQGKPIEQAYPSQPVVVLGFETVPGVGEKFKTYATAEDALLKIKKEGKKKEQFISVLPIDSDKKLFNIILKSDVSGSLEAIEGVLKTLPQEKVILRILKSEVGDINESDVKLAEMTKARIVGFRVKKNPAVSRAIRKEKKVSIKTFEIIYELIQEVRQMMEKAIEPEKVRKDMGKIKALVLFWGEKNRQIVGGKIIEGEIRKGLKLEVLRGETKVGEGKIINLQRDKKDMEKLVKGDECGILFEGNVKIEEKDILVAYTEERRKGEL
jgi:translation initiation factor IF-2